ncbi:hypothetical protein ACS0TY_024019 [Phlomoides rotata]
MTELLGNPEKMARSRNELINVIGKNKQVEESDISKLPYLQSVIKETFRCHTPGPLLVPRKAEDGVQINGGRICPGLALADRMMHLMVCGGS